MDDRMSTQPNILLITTDQQRFTASGGDPDWAVQAGPPFLRTPHFDFLRREGTTFTAAYADCPVCVPARMSIMSGKYVFSHGMFKNGRSVDVLGREETLPACLHGLGYQTVAVGKMHFTPQYNRHGFDEMLLCDDYYRQMRRKGLEVMPMRHGLGQNELYPGMATVPEAMTLTAWTVEQCVDFVKFRRDPTQPFFLWCSFSKPHPPFDPPEPYYSMYRDCAIPRAFHSPWSGSEDCPYALRDLQQRFSFDLVPDQVIREARSAYYGLISQIDYNMGRLFAALVDEGELDNTLIIYASDHGEYLGDHHCGGKGFFHESSAHVPFVLRPPKTWRHSPRGIVRDVSVTHADIMPTLIAAAGGAVSETMDGCNLLEVITRDYVVSGYRRLDDDNLTQVGITNGKWKYIWFSEGGQEQLFNLHTDPGEMDNLAHNSAYLTEKEELRDELVAFLREKYPAAFDGDRLRESAFTPLSESERRSGSWPGFHTDYSDVDTRH